MIRLLPSKDLQRSGFVARVYSLRDVALAEIAASRATPLSELGSADSARISVKIDDNADATLLNDGSKMAVRVHFKVTARHAERDVVSVTGCFDLRYERTFNEGMITEDDANLFSRINGVYNAWPYMRELVASTFMRLGYPPFTMDSLVISPDPEEKPVPAKQ